MGGILKKKSSNPDTVDPKIVNQTHATNIQIAGNFRNRFRRSSSTSNESSSSGSSHFSQQKAGKRVFCSPLNLAAEHGHHEV